MKQHRKILRCPIHGCGARYEDLPGLPAERRLSKHLTGKHCLSGKRYLEAMREALEEAQEREGR